MGIIKATFNAIGGNLADSWLEVLEADEMSDTTVFTKAVAVRRGERRNNNKRGSSDVISNGSVIHVYPNQFMILTEGGKIIDYTAEEGYYKVDNSAAPSLFNGEFGASLADAFRRIKFSGTPSYAQKAYFINLQEIKGIKFGTRTPINYFDNFYNSELFLRAHGNYSIKVTDPIKFYSEVIPKNADRVDINQINEQYLSEFLEALGAAINNMSADGIRISYVTGKSRELSKYMADELDEDWKSTRGFEIQSVGIASLSYDEDSKELINMRNKGAMLGDAAIREGYVQGSVARGFEAAGSNSAGASQAFVGMGMGMGAGGGFMASASETNRRQMEMQEMKAREAAKADSWTCTCGNVASGKFCSECGAKKPEQNGSWTCTCGNVATGKFCSNCGAKAPEAEWFCTDCGAKNPADAKFCSNCGKKK